MQLQQYDGLGKRNRHGRHVHLQSRRGRKRSRLPGPISVNANNNLFNIQLKSRTGTAANPTNLHMSGANNTYSGTTSVTGNAVLGLETGVGWTAAPGAYQANNLTLDGGGVQALTLATISANSGITLTANGGYLSATGGNTLAANSIITGSGSLGVAYNGGTVTLGAANSYQGDTVIGARPRILGRLGICYPRCCQRRTIRPRLWQSRGQYGRHVERQWVQYSPSTRSTAAAR